MDEEPKPDASESGTLEGNPGNLSTQPNQNAYQQTVAYAPVKSQVPKIFGIFMMIYGVIVGLFGIVGVFGIGGVISDYENAGIEISGLQTAWFYISAISGLIVTGAVAYGGYETYNYKKRGVMIGLGAVAFGFVLSLGDTAITGDIAQQLLDSTGEAEVEGLGALGAAAPGAAAGLGLGRAHADALAEPTHQGRGTGCATLWLRDVLSRTFCCVVAHQVVLSGDCGMSVHIPSKLSLAQPARVPWARMESPLTAWERQVGCTASRVESRSSSGPHEECRLLGSSP